MRFGAFGGLVSVRLGHSATRPSCAGNIRMQNLRHILSALQTLRKRLSRPQNHRQHPKRYATFAPKISVKYYEKLTIDWKKPP
jgi:hypothetical protein